MTNRGSTGSATAAVRCALAALALLAAASAPAEGARILAMLPHPGRSHQMVFEPLLDELAARGHELTVVSFFPRKNMPPNYKDVPLSGILGVFQEVIELSMFEPLPLGLDRLSQLSVMRMLSDWALEVCDRMQTWPALQPLYDNAPGSFDLVLIEMFSSGCGFGLAHLIGAPMIGLTSHQDLAWWTGTFGHIDNPSYFANVMLPFNYEMSISDRVGNTLMMVIQRAWFEWVCWRETKIVRARLGSEIPSMTTIRRKMTLQLLNTHHSLNGRHERPPSSIEVGGLHLPRKINTTLPPELESILSKSNPGVVLFSFGSMVRATTLPKERRDTFLRAFSKLKHTVLWKYEDPSDLDLPPNVHTLPWIPQAALLNHPKVVAFIAHGGLLGMTEAVDAGVPMLVMPFFGDQPGNAAAAEAAGLATVLPYRHLTQRSLDEALQKVLSPKMRESAANLSRVWRDRPAPPLDTAVYWVERTARLGHAAVMHSPARDMPLYQLLLLDVIAVCLLASAALLLITVYLVKAFLYIISVVLNRKTKEKIN